MTESEAHEWIVLHHGQRVAEMIKWFLNMVFAESQAQNLIAPSTLETIWSRHVVDSAQLVRFARPGRWIDIGTGGGFPGMVVAIARPEPITLVEPRKRRAAFLEHCARTLGLTHVRVDASAIERITDRAEIISARAVASVEKLLQIGAGCAKKDTRWLLPRGRLTEADLVELRNDWDGTFHVEQSLTDPESAILIIDRLGRR